MIHWDAFPRFLTTLLVKKPNTEEPLNDFKSCLWIVVGDRLGQNVESQTGLATLFILHRLKINLKEKR